jgi:hypothetical protein
MSIGEAVSRAEPQQPITPQWPNDVTPQWPITPQQPSDDTSRPQNGLIMHQRQNDFMSKRQNYVTKRKTDVQLARQNDVTPRWRNNDDLIPLPPSLSAAELLRRPCKTSPLIPCLGDKIKSAHTYYDVVPANKSSKNNNNLQNYSCRLKKIYFQTLF